MKNKVLQGDCLEVLKTLEDNSVDSIVTDPPYELGFMGKSWDSTGIANNKEMWAECLRVLKPGGHLLAFSGTRTYHRMAVAIEDAGFEVRDMIEWVYGSGFPKSLNIGKAVDKNKGRLSYGLDKLQNVLNAERKQKGLTLKDMNIMWGAPENSGLAAHKLCDKSQPQFITREQMDILDREWGLKSKYAEIYEEAEREFIGLGKAGLTAGTIANFAGEKEFDITKGTSEFEGWGTALKPAHEPICMARKPLSEPTVASNCLKWGTGGINIDESRVAGNWGGSPNRTNSPETKQVYGDYGKIESEQSPLGRFPANLIHDNSEEVRECFPETKSGAHKAGQPRNAESKTSYVMPNITTFTNEGSSGNASRFFKSIIYQAKASKSERNKGCEGLEEKEGIRTNAPRENEDTKTPTRTNNHPTVKPIALMEYLIKMVTPKGGIVLDPFSGSGSTLVAAKQNGFDYIGIEMTAEYIPIIEARLEVIKPENKLF